MRLDLDPGGASMDRSFVWDESDANRGPQVLHTGGRFDAVLTIPVRPQD